MKKIYVLDTNILMQSPRALFGFADNDIYLPTTVIRELDKHKTDSGERGYNTREVIRMLEDLRRSYVATHAAGEEIKGIEMPNGGTLHIAESEIDHPDFLPRDLGLSYDIPDMRIIGAVYKLTKENTEPVILVTNDAAMRFNAFVSTKNSITIQNYRNETIETDERYTGKAELTVNPSVIGKLYKEKQIDFKEVLESFMESALYENEYMHFVANDGSQQSAVGIFRDGKINLINADITTYGGITGKNLSQKCLLHALMQPAEQIPLVIAKGPAGTGKTLLSVACGLDGTYDDHTGRRYNEMLLTRSIPFLSYHTDPLFCKELSRFLHLSPPHKNPSGSCGKSHNQTGQDAPGYHDNRTVPRTYPLFSKMCAVPHTAVYYSTLHCNE